MANVKNQLEQFLIAIDATPESVIRDIMGDEYIDTPGYYSEETEHYDDIFDFMIANMGESNFERLVEWHDRNPEGVEKIIAKVF